jgi:hypothetical protein
MVIRIHIDNGIRISPSNRGRCTDCGNWIGKGEPRVEMSFPYHNTMSKDLYCYKCSDKRIVNEMKMLVDCLKVTKKMRKELKKLLSTEDMNKLLLANQLYLKNKPNGKTNGKMWIS